MDILIRYSLANYFNQRSKCVLILPFLLQDLVVVPHVVEVAVEVPLVEEAEVEQTVSRLVLEVLGPIRRRHLTIKSNEFQPPSP